MPVRAIGMILGIPEQDQKAARDDAEGACVPRGASPLRYTDDHFQCHRPMFTDYIDWRATPRPTI